MSKRKVSHDDSGSSSQLNGSGYSSMSQNQENQPPNAMLEKRKKTETNIDTRISCINQFSDVSQFEATQSLGRNVSKHSVSFKLAFVSLSDHLQFSNLCSSRKRTRTLEPESLKESMSKTSNAIRCSSSICTIASILYWDEMEVVRAQSWMRSSWFSVEGLHARDDKLAPRPSSKPMLSKELSIHIWHYQLFPWVLNLVHFPLFLVL